MSRRSLTPQPIKVDVIKPTPNISQVVASLRADHFTDVLAEARQLPLDEFRKAEQAWADANVPALFHGTETIIQNSLRKVTIADAESAHIGALMGGAVIRGITAEGLISVESCNQNLVDNGVINGMIYTGQQLDYESLTSILGEGAATGLDEVRNPVSRTLCGVVVGLAIIPVEIT